MAKHSIRIIDSSGLLFLLCSGKDPIECREIRCAIGPIYKLTDQQEKEIIEFVQKYRCRTINTNSPAVANLLRSNGEIS